MKYNLLTSLDEITDQQLSDLMKQVAIEAKKNASIAQKKLDEKIRQDIKNAQNRIKSRK